MSTDAALEAEQARQRAALAAATAPAPVRRYPPCTCAACVALRADQAELATLRARVKSLESELQQARALEALRDR